MLIVLILLYFLKINDDRLDQYFAANIIKPWTMHQINNLEDGLITTIQFQM